MSGFVDGSAGAGIGLLAPVMGSETDDTLVATAAGDVLMGMGGRDWLEAAFNAVTLDGGDHADTLRHVIDMEIWDGPADPFLAVQNGGAGNDDMSVVIDVFNPSGIDIDVLVDGGAGRDTIDVRVGSVSYGSSNSVTSINGGGGDDVITASLAGMVIGGTSVIVSRIDGGGGDDVITSSSGSAPENLEAHLDEIIRGGSGNDTISVRHSPGGDGAYEAYPFTSKAVLLGGIGNDEITFDGSFSFDNSSPHFDTVLNGGGGADVLRASLMATPYAIGYTNDALIETILLGGAGSDVLRIEQSFGGHGTIISSSRMAGGAGNDDLWSSISLTGLSNGPVESDQTLLGGGGDDSLSLEVTAANYAGFEPTDNVDLRAVLKGGGGADRLTLLYQIAPDGESDGQAVALLDGGTGNDVLTARLEVHGSVAGRAVLLGGAGNDSLTVDMGENNLLSGGVGDDTMTGGSGSDIFEFIAGVDEGSDVIRGWDPLQDALNIHLSTGPVADSGAPGLADDLDALALFVDDGTDVTVTLSGGTVIRFEGAGTGSVSGFADLVADPLTQLLSDPGLQDMLLA
jgi:Ca2+-binding RTX toxin-like protein